MEHAPAAGPGNQPERLPDLAGIGGVHRIAQVEQGRAQGVPGVVDEQHVPGVLVVIQSAPAVRLLIHHIRVVDESQGAPGVGDGVPVLRVVGQVAEAPVDFFKVGNLAVVQLLQHPLLHELGDHVVGGDDDVVVRAAAFQQGVEGFVALGGLVVHPDAGGVLKLADEILVDILPPGADVDNRLGGGGPGEKHHRRQKGAGHGPGQPPAGPPIGGLVEFHGQLFEEGGLPDLLPGLPPLLADLPHVVEHQQGQHRQKQQGGHGVDLRGDALFGHGVDAHGQGGGGRACGEVGDDKVINGHGEGDERPGDDARLDLRQDHLPEGLHPGAAQVLGRVYQVFVHLAQLGGHVEDDIGNVEGHMGQQHGAEAQGEADGQLHRPLHAVEPLGEGPPALEEGHEEQAQGHAGDDVRVHHGDVVDHQQGVPPALG